MLKRHAASEAGSSIVELALVVPMLALVLIGAAELGRIAYAAIEVSNAARAAVSFGAQGPGTAINTAANIASMKLIAANEAPNITGLTTTATQTCVCETVNATSGATTQSPITGPCGGAGGGSTLPTTAATQCATAAAIAGPGNIGNVVDYVNVTTTASVNTMFKYTWNGYGLPSTFKLNGYAQMRFLQN